MSLNMGDSARQPLPKEVMSDAKFNNFSEYTGDAADIR